MNQAVLSPETRALKSEQSLQMPIAKFADFYQFYLTEHSNVISRRLHVIGSLAGAYGIYKTLRTGKKSYLLKGLITGYGCAWIGHFFFEKNKPASFKQPLYSFMSDWRMLADVCRGKVSLRHIKHDKV